MTLDELLTKFKNECNSDIWHLVALDRFFYLHDLTAPWRGTEEAEYLLLKQWVENMVAAGVQVEEEQ